MGLPVDAEDSVCNYEQRGEGGGGESQTESQVSKLPLPVRKKKRKGRKRYFNKQMSDRRCLAFKFLLSHPPFVFMKLK